MEGKSKCFFIESQKIGYQNTELCIRFFQVVLYHTLRKFNDIRLEKNNVFNNNNNLLPSQLTTFTVRLSIGV